MRGEYRVKNEALRALSVEAAALARRARPRDLHRRSARAQRARRPPGQRGAGPASTSPNGDPGGPGLYSAARADVAQLARASACHAEGRGFESLHPLHEKAPLTRGFRRLGSQRSEARGNRMATLRLIQRRRCSFESSARRGSNGAADSIPTLGLRFPFRLRLHVASRRRSVRKPGRGSLHPAHSQRSAEGNDQGNPLRVLRGSERQPKAAW